MLLKVKIKIANNNFLFNILVVFIILSSALTAQSISNSWYVDNAATGNNDGTSWTDAWESFTDVVWSSINPGDTVWVSGGATSKTYTETLRPTKSGTLGNYIVIIRGTTTGHNGEPHLSATVNPSSANYWELNGFSMIKIEHSIGNTTAFHGHWRFKNLIWRNMTNLGIRLLNGPRFVEILNCEFQQAPVASGENDCIFIRSDWDDDHAIYPMADSIFVIGCIFQLETNTANASHTDGLQTNFAEDIWYEGNKVYLLTDKSIYAQAMYLSQNQGKVYVLNNIFYVDAPVSYTPIIAVHRQGATPTGATYCTVDSAYFIDNTIISKTDAGRVPLFESITQGAVIKNNYLAHTGTVPVYHFGQTNTNSVANITADYNYYYRPIGNPSSFTSSYATSSYNSWIGAGKDAHSTYVTTPQPSFVSFDWAFTRPWNITTIRTYNLNLVTPPDGTAFTVSFGGRTYTSDGKIGAYLSDGSVVVDLTPPNLLSASVINPTTIELTFSEALENSSALTKTNYSIDNGIVVNSVSLSTDGKQVTLNTTTNAANQTYTVVVINVKDLAGNIISSTNNSAQYFYVGDTTPPELLSANAIDLVTVVLKFSEALDVSSSQLTANYSITNGISINQAVLSSDGKEVILSTSEHQTTIFYIVTVANVKDVAGNIVSPANNSVQYNYLGSSVPVLVKYSITQAYSANWYQDYTPDKSIDGQGSLVPTSRWAGAYPMPDTISFDLGTNRLISETRISFYNWDGGRKYKYNILISEDGINWQTALSGVWSDVIEWNIEDFTPINARYIKLISLENDQSVYAGVWEMEIWGPSSSDTDTIGNLKADVKVFLQGPFQSNIMITELSNNAFIPSQQPYNIAPWNYNGNESLPAGQAGLSVDWILVELRSAQNPGQVISRRAGLLRNDGRIMEPDGTLGITFDNLLYGSYYIAVHHRNHLAVMTSAPVLFSPDNSLYDFTNSLTSAYGQNAMAEITAGVFGMFAGDGNGDGGITISDHNDIWLPQNGSFGYLKGDFNLDCGVTIHDVNLYWNPNNGSMSQVP